ncbi:hypothetical protein YC2023_033573 [Brassica napus]
MERRFQDGSDNEGEVQDFSGKRFGMESGVGAHIEKIFQISGRRRIVCVIGGTTDQLVQHCLRYIDNLNSVNLCDSCIY